MIAYDLVEAHINYYGDITQDYSCEYSIRFLYKSSYVENDIFNIHYKSGDSENRMGWLFPAHSICSNNHDYFLNQHYIHYAKVAASILNKSPEFNISDNTHILILKDEYLYRNQICIENFIVPLIKYGYYQKEHNNIYTNSIINIDYKTSKKIVLHKYPDPGQLNKYTQDLLENILPSTNDFLSRFICMYQMFEMLIEFIYNKKIDQLRNARNTIGTIREKISEYSSERKLLGYLFSEHFSRKILRQEEKELVRKIFTNYKEQQYYDKLDLPSFIYDIRNCIVHNYYKYELSPLMQEIADTTEILLVELLESESLHRAIKNK